ncbi:MAG: hypothetical protein NC923_01585 [Candidatus Omnitrophica bacterium]|nr:hypothetical protein [Candidatus Omnitrophota bacterium]
MILSCKRPVFFVIRGIILSALLVSATASFAADTTELISLKKNILEATCKTDIAKLFEQLKESYFKENRYSDFVDFLKSLSRKESCILTAANYYIALARYNQLKYLEENQLWDEYFSQGNNYRDDITFNAQRVIERAEESSPYLLRSSLLLWQFHYDQQDPFAQEALAALIKAVFGYNGKYYGIIKEVADKLQAYGENASAKQLYRLYADKLLASLSGDEQLKTAAQDFYQQGNLQLAQSFFDIYIERISKNLARTKDKLCPSLIEIAKLFTYKDSGLKDCLYAEKVFQKLEDLCGREVFDEELLYLRAFNLEKAKELTKAKDIYLQLLQLYPQTIHANKVDFKIGIVYAYVLRDLVLAKTYFNKLADKNEKDPYVISSLYQLGLLAQWQDDIESARNYYNKLLNLAGTDYQDIVALTQQRLGEIQDKKPIAYNLKTFLDLSVKDENPLMDMTKSALEISPYLAKKNDSIQISSETSMPPSGCMQPEVRYLWSGDTGAIQPQDSDSNFNTSYVSAGTKVINLIVALPAGFFDRNIDLVDIE